eukprot:TRINITY_DN4902_c0_g1_i1.p1 TRINITY_DN4902_c0_g1~~TRINITY_DN4902_c0_g1_i1.p1  ORF type:complete len:253 (+),score=31.41 TRINITY_DN4902_c0_g1_i1:21-779(+)
MFRSFLRATTYLPKFVSPFSKSKDSYTKDEIARRIHEAFVPKGDKQKLNIYFDDTINKIQSNIVQFIQKDTKRFESLIGGPNGMLKQRQLSMTKDDRSVILSRDQNNMSFKVEFQIPKDMSDLTKVDVEFHLKPQIGEKIHIKVNAMASGDFLFKEINSSKFNLSMAVEKQVLIYESLELLGFDKEIIKLVFLIIEQHYAKLLVVSTKNLEQFFRFGLTEEELNRAYQPPIKMDSKDLEDEDTFVAAFTKKM